MLTFLTPWWGAAMLAAVGAPLLAHLLSRKGGRVAVFPAVRFVQQAAADVARLLRPRHWLLMALRMAMLALVVLAFMQPVWHRTAAASDDDGLHVVILVDRSASMNRLMRGVTLFDEAKRQAAQLLDSLDPARDRASIVFVDSRPSALLPEPSANFSELSRRLRVAEPTWQRGRLDEALRLAAGLTAPPAPAPGSATPHRTVRIELFTDAQATAWPASTIRNLAASLRIHRIGDAAGNVAVSRPVLAPARPVAAQPATLTVDVANHSPRRRPITVEMRLGDRTHRQTVTVDPFTVSAAGFPVTISDVGPALVELSTVDVDDDALTIDNRTGLVAEVAAARDVMLVTQASPADARTAAYFVARAVSPDERGRAAGVDLTIASPADLAAALPSAGPSQVLILVEAAALSDAALSVLHQRLEAGDGLIWIIDSPAAADALQRFAASPIIPAPSHPWITDDPRSLDTGRFDHPVLAVFEGPARSALLRQAFRRSMRGVLAPDAQPLLSFEDGSPAMAARWLGAGRVTVIAADLSPASTDLAKGPLLVPLLHQLIRHAAPGVPTPPNPHPGEPLSLQVEPGQVIRGSGDAASPGLHAVVDQASGALVRGVWVELDPAESDLRPADRDAGVDAGASAASVPAPDRAQPTVAVRDVGVELWPYAVLAALLLAGAETLLLWRLYPAAAGEVARA